LNATSDLKNDHLLVRRLGVVIQMISDKLYDEIDNGKSDMPLEDIEIASVIMEEFVDRFHHGKEEQGYFPETRDKDSFSENVRKFLIEHELGRRIAKMLRSELVAWRKNVSEGAEQWFTNSRKEPVARFFKSYAVFISDHTGKEDRFFDIIEDKGSISIEEDDAIRKHYEICKNQTGGQVRIEQLLALLEYLEHRDWMHR
jgi:hemerythrin-like domain-containing protein